MHRGKISIRMYALGIAILVVVAPAILSGSCFSETKYTICEKTGKVCPVGWACTADQRGCTADGCGDGIIQKEKGEECDDGNKINGYDLAIDNCDSNCKVMRCGNGVKALDKDGLPEICDDGNTEDDDGCDANCTLTGCGNGVLTKGEECDDGDNDPGDGCSANCTIEMCGNGIVDPLDDCDLGVMNSDDGSCTSMCKVAECGDGNVYLGYEDCDDGNRDNNDGCDENCTPTGCGNGIKTSGEACDDGNGNECGTCSDNCQTFHSSAATGEICLQNLDIDGQTFLIGDGYNTPKRFEFDNDNMHQPLNVRININGMTSIPTVYNAMVSIINNAPSLLIKARREACVVVTNERATSLGNIEIEVSSTKVSARGMSGGAGGNCLSGMSCRADADCKSMTCLPSHACGCENSSDCPIMLNCVNMACVMP